MLKRIVMAGVVAGLGLGVAACGPTKPPYPGDSKNCSSFSSQAAAQAWFNTYYPWYGDVAKLDADNDLIACEGR